MANEKYFFPNSILYAKKKHRLEELSGMKKNVTRHRKEFIPTALIP